MRTIAITTAGRANNDIKVSSYRLNICNLVNNYLPQTINQLISTYVKRTDF